MKIAIVISEFLPKWVGGTEIATYNIAKHLAGRGHEVHVITLMDNGFPKETMVDGFHLHRVMRSRIRGIGALIFWVNTVQCIKKTDPDIVHTQSLLAGIPGLVAKLFLKKPYTVWGQGSDVYRPWTFKKPLGKEVIKHAHKVFALTQDMKAEMQRIHKRDDIIVLPNGIDLGRFENVKKEKAVNKEQKTILFVGSLRPVKGVEYLIEAMSIIKKENNNFQLKIIGDGEDRKKIETRIKEMNLSDCITLMGKIPNEEIPRYMINSDIFVLPSLSEGFPCVILEAMASGLPIITTKIPALQEIVIEGVNGFLVEPKNSSQLADMIMFALTNYETSNKISINNKIKAGEYRWENIVKRLEEFMT